MARPVFRKVNEALLDHALRGLGILNYQTQELSGERYFIDKLLPKYIDGTDPVFVDVGANVGLYSNLLFKNHPQATIWSFEPNPKTFEKLTPRLASNTITAINKGLGANDAKLTFYDRKDLNGSSAFGSLYKDVIEDIHQAESIEIEVEITTLDSYASETGIDSIQLLKIDTEGHELEVLKGAQKLLRNDQIDLIHIEFNEMNVISRVFYRDFAQTLQNYTPYRLLPKGVLPLRKKPRRNELFAYQNLVFVNNRFKPNKQMHPTAVQCS